jgi:hypothetical protein
VLLVDAQMRSDKKSAVRKQRFVLQKSRSLAKKKRAPETALGPAAHFLHGF